MTRCPTCRLKNKAKGLAYCKRWKGFSNKIDDMPGSLDQSIIKPITAILSELNKDGGSDWVEIEGYHLLQACRLDGTKKPNPIYLVPTGVVLKAFLNIKTGETKLYLAKVLNIPDREALW